VGEQFVDLFAAGAYAVSGRIFAALAQPSLAWIFYVLAASGLLWAIFVSAVENRPDFWLRHLAAVAFASVLTLLPRQFDLGPLTYGAPGRIEQALGTHQGAAPHLTYWIERLGASAAVALRGLTSNRPALAIPGIDGQVREIASDPGLLADAQLRANLEIWRRRLVPALLALQPSLAQDVRSAGLEEALRNPTPGNPVFEGPESASRVARLRTLLDRAAPDLSVPFQDVQPSALRIAEDAGATPWLSGAQGKGVQIRLCQRLVPPAWPPVQAGANEAWTDAMSRARALTTQMRGTATGCEPQAFQSLAQLHKSLGESILMVAGTNLVLDPARAAMIGNLCQRAGDDSCRLAMAPLFQASTRLVVPPSDRYNEPGWTTLLEQPIASVLLAITSLLMGALSTLVVSVLPFALGVAKALAILVSVFGAWLLLWPGHVRIALSWMVGPISFVSLWSVLFQIWSDIEPALMQVGSVVAGSDFGSLAAGRAMSIAVSLGYLGLPSLALGIVYGQSGRALYHASSRMENALLAAWHTRGTILSFGRRWLASSPLARRWNQRTYKAVGLGTLRRAGAGTRSTARIAAGAKGGVAAPAMVAASAIGTVSTAASKAGTDIARSAARGVAPAPTAEPVTAPPRKPRVKPPAKP